MEGSHSRDILAGLAFERWGEPCEGEPSYGMVIRIMSLNGQIRTASAAFQLDVNGRDLKPDECLALMLRHPMEKAGDLVLNTPVIAGHTVSLRGHAFRRRDWSIEFRRFCPACLAESVHHRNWWDLQFMITCPFHGLRLDGGRPDGRRVGWSRTDLAWSGGELLPQFGVARLDPMPRTFEAYVLGRLGLAPALEVPPLDGHEVRSVVEAVQEIGRLLAGGWRRSVPAIGRGKGRLDAAAVNAAGFDVLSRGDGGIRVALSALASSCPDGRRDVRAEVGVSRMFGWAYAAFAGNANPLLNDVARRMVDIAVADGRVRRASRLVGGRDHELGRLTLKEVARHLGVDRERVARLVERALPDFDRARVGYRVHLTKEDVLALGEALSGALDRSAVARLLGLRARDVRGLEKAALLTPCPGLGTRGRLRFLSSEVLALAARIPCLDAIRPTRVAREVPFHAYARLKGRTVAELVADVIAGTARPVSRIDGRSGFGGLAFAADGAVRVSILADRGRTQVVRGGITFGEAAVRLGVTHPTVAALVREGHLTVIDADRTGTGLERIDAASLKAFEVEHVTAKSLAGMLGCHPASASQRLRQMGIEPILDPGGPRQITVIVRRREVDLGIATVGEPRTNREEFWSRARTELARSCPAFLLPPTPPTDAVLWNSRRTARVCVTLDERKLTLHMECDAATSRRRYLRAVERRRQIERHSGFDWIDYGSGVRLLAQYGALDLAQRSTWASAIGWMAMRLAELQAAFGGRQGSAYMGTIRDSPAQPTA